MVTHSGLNEKHLMAGGAASPFAAGCIGGLSENACLSANGTNAASQVLTTLYALHVHYLGAVLSTSGPGLLAVGCTAAPLARAPVPCQATGDTSPTHTTCLARVLVWQQEAVGSTYASMKWGLDWSCSGGADRAPPHTPPGRRTLCCNETSMPRCPSASRCEVECSPTVLYCNALWLVY